jgi:hypothetical protein
MDHLKGDRDALVRYCVDLLMDDEESVQWLMELPYGTIFPLKRVSPDSVRVHQPEALQQGMGSWLHRALELEQAWELGHWH